MCGRDSGKVRRPFSVLLGLEHLRPGLAEVELAQLLFDLYLPQRYKTMGVEQEPHRSSPVQKSSGNGASKSSLMVTVPGNCPKVRGEALRGLGVVDQHQHADLLGLDLVGQLQVDFVVVIDFGFQFNCLHGSSDLDQVANTVRCRFQGCRDLPQDRGTAKAAGMRAFVLIEA
jgi:hypothetical protein